MSVPSAWRGRKSLRTVKITLVVLMLAALLAPVISTPRAARAAGAYTTDYLNLRAGPSTSNRVKLVMPPGTYVEILGDLSDTGYYKVAYAGEPGYAFSDYLSFGSDGGGVDAGWGNAGAAYTTDYLNLRTGPGLSFGVILVMPVRAALQLTGAVESGYSGVVYSGNNGWASNDYLAAEGSNGGNSADPGDGDAGTAYTTSGLNLRTGPSLSNDVILVIPDGAAVRLTGKERNGFAGVRYSGEAGWASLDYLTMANSGNGDGSYTGDEIVDIIYAAADKYGQSRSAMLAVARCESLLDPYVINPYSQASGLFQFLPGTWATTPWANANILDPVANAEAAAWMWSVGRRGEWVC
jgi:uncharacterized protein YraI